MAHRCCSVKDAMAHHCLCFRSEVPSPLLSRRFARGAGVVRGGRGFLEPGLGSGRLGSVGLGSAWVGWTGIGSGLLRAVEPEQQPISGLAIAGVLEVVGQVSEGAGEALSL